MEFDWQTDFLTGRRTAQASSPFHPVARPSWAVRQGSPSFLCSRSSLNHVHDPTSDPDFDSDEAITLDRTLTSFRTLIPDEIDNFARYCGVIGYATGKTAPRWK